MPIGLSGIFIIASVLQGLFLALMIWRMPYFRSATNNYLAGYLAMVSGMTLLGWQEWELFWPNYIWSLMWEFLMPVLLFQYYLRVLSHPYLKASWLRWGYAPFIAILVVDVVFDGDYSFDLYQLPIPVDHPGYIFYDDLLDSLALWWNIGITGWAFHLAWNDRTAEPAKRQWLIRFSVAVLIIIAVWFLSDYIEWRTQVEDPYAMLWLTISIFFWYVAYAGVYRLRLLDERTEIRGLLLRQPVPPPTPVLAPVATASETNYAPRLRRLMEHEELFRDPDLGRQLLAERLGISEGYVTEVVRESTGEGVVDYINGLRIEAAKRMLRTADFAPYSLEAIGREAGFRSRSAFYDCFKKATGETPGLFRKRLKTS